MRNKEMKNTELPRERLVRVGPQSLSTPELIAIILGRGTSGSSVFSISHKIVQQNLLQASVRQLQNIRGIGEAQACKIVASVALAKRLPKKTKNPKLILSSPSLVFDRFKHLQDLEQEHFYGIYVDARKQIIAEQLLFKGTVDATVVHPRDVFRYALEANAWGVIIVHNHPSGQCDPSDQDILFTEKLASVGAMMHIPLIDHIIVGKNYWSWAESK